MGFYWGFVLVEILFGAFLVVASAVPAIGVNDRSAVGAAGGMILIGLLWSGSASWSGRLPTGLEVYQEDLLGESSV